MTARSYAGDTTAADLHGSVQGCTSRGHTSRGRLGRLRGAAAAINKSSFAIRGAVDVLEAEPAWVTARAHTCKA